MSYAEDGAYGDASIADHGGYVEGDHGEGDYGYDPAADYGDGGVGGVDEEDDELDPLEEDISQEDAWVVISSYFSEKGLVRQQLDSFDEVYRNKSDLSLRAEMGESGG